MVSRNFIEGYSNQDRGSAFSLTNFELLEESISVVESEARIMIVGGTMKAGGITHDDNMVTAW